MATQPVNVNAAQAPKKRRPKFAPGGTPRQRLILASAAVLCVIVALLLPRINFLGDDSNDPPAAPATPANTNVSTGGAHGSGPAVGGPAVKVQVKDTGSPAKRAAEVAEHLKKLSKQPPKVVHADGDLIPLDELTRFPASTDDDINQRILDLSKYFMYGAGNEREESYKRMLDLGDNLVKRLPRLIKTCSPFVLGRFADAMRDLKAVGAVDAAIERINMHEPNMLGHFELLRALIALDDSKGKAYVYNVLSSGDLEHRTMVWELLKGHLDEQHLDIVFNAASEGTADAYKAAEVLAKYGETPDKAAALVQRIDPLIDQKTGCAKYAFIMILNGIHPSASGSTLVRLVNDQDVGIRYAAIPGLARNPVFADLVVNAIRSDRDDNVRIAAIKGLMENPANHPKIVADLVKLLDDKKLSLVAHDALVKANNGNDLGTLSSDWQFWYKSGGFKVANQKAMQMAVKPVNEILP